MLVDMNNAKSRSGFENDAAAAPNAATATPSPIPARRRASKRTFDLYTNTEAKLPTMIATIANTSIVFRCFELRSFPIKSIDASMPQSSVEANIAARSAGNSEFCDIARRMPGIAIEMKARSEEHTSELQSLMRISYAVFCLKKQNKILKLIQINKTRYLTYNNVQHNE